ncbi:hypothetical protein AB0D59_47790 [Streptomyces sp. NPDC048417]|uniref:hypothetical protein n=1 Tax=Streptomyces sp. NPDC048417 TaxID=3155387 RepID=UPI00343734FF
MRRRPRPPECHRPARETAPLDPADSMAEEHLAEEHQGPSLRTAGRDLAHYEDVRHHFLARAARATG